jgi:hypothetical protein
MNVPAFTIISEFAFSLTSRIIDGRRRCSLTRDMTEILTCLKDWELGEGQKQQQMENK